MFFTYTSMTHLSATNFNTGSLWFQQLSYAILLKQMLVSSNFAGFSSDFYYGLVKENYKQQLLAAIVRFLRKLLSIKVCLMNCANLSDIVLIQTYQPI